MLTSQRAELTNTQDTSIQNSLAPRIESVLVAGSSADLQMTIAVNSIIAGYSKAFGIDVSRYFANVKTVGVYRCCSSGLCFYAPFTVSGDSGFYEQLQKFPWYYVPWKWEHEIALKYLSNGQQILEIGCAKGSFLEKAMSVVTSCVGLELNSEAQKEATKNALEVHCETIQEHSLRNANRYDLLCSFQLMEHISDLNAVLQASIDSVKNGGRLIISVPNNSSFLKHAESVLNMPPHHMCLWDESSLTKLQDFFSLKLEALHFEPLQDYHYSLVLESGINRLVRLPLARRIMKRLARQIRAQRAVHFVRNRIRGFTILAVYKKI